MGEAKAKETAAERVDLVEGLITGVDRPPADFEDENEDEDLLEDEETDDGEEK